MEDALDAIVIGVAEDAFVNAHRLLLVASKEIHLDTSHTAVAQPLHLLLADDGIVHGLTRALGSVVPGTVAVVPYPGTDTFLLAVGEELLHSFATDVLVPSAVDEAAFPAEGGSEVDVLDLVVEVDTGILPHNPRPCVARTLIIDGWFVERFYDIPCNGGLDDGLQRWAQSDGTPRSVARHIVIGVGIAVAESDLRTCAAEAIVLALHGEGNGEEAFGSGIGEVAGAIVAADTCLGNQEPPLVALVEQTGESPTLAGLTTFCDRLVPDVAFFIAGLGALPPDHRVALLADESSGIGGEPEAGSFASDDDCASLATLQETVAIGNIVVEDGKLHGHNNPAISALGGSENKPQTVFFAVDLALFALTEVVVVLDGTFVANGFLEGEILRKIGHIGIDTKGRIKHHWHIERVGFRPFLLGFRNGAVACRIRQLTIGKFHIKVG